MLAAERDGCVDARKLGALTDALNRGAEGEGEPPVCATGEWLRDTGHFGGPSRFATVLSEASPQAQRFLEAGL